MSTEALRPEFGADQHPDENRLLLALERELSPEEAAEIERHIGICWNCRARYHEIQSGILAFIEYREKLYLPALDSAPRDFRGFPFLLNNTATESRKIVLLDRVRNRIRGFLSSFSQIPIQARWVSASATLMVAVLLWTQVLHPGAISASELLIKAAQTQNPPVTNRKVRQKVRVKTAKTETVREFEWETGTPIPGARWGTDPENWTAPMTAEGFSQWHDSLTSPKDKVKKSGDYWTLNTVAPSGPIKEASIVIRTADFHPTEQHIRFADDRKVDISEVAFEVAETPVAFAAPAAQKAWPAQSQVEPPRAEQPPAPSQPAVNLDEAELALRYAMFAQHLDDDEDVQITRGSDAVVVGGVASSAERLRQLQAALAGLPGVRLSVSLPAPAGGGAVSATSQRPGVGASAPLLRDGLNDAFASASARQNFVDGVLAASDSALSHAWVLKKLTERYTDADRRALGSESQSKLDEMLRSHLQQLAAANTTLNGLVDLLPPPQALRADARTGVAALFDLVQRQDSLVAALVAGTQTTDSAVTASDSFRTAHGAIARLARELGTNMQK